MTTTEPRPADEATLLVSQWLPALDGVVDKLQAGVSVAGVGCGLGAAAIIMAKAFGRCTFLGIDNHEISISTARQAAAIAGVAQRARFEVASAQELPGAGYDLVCLFDCLHDMGDPVGAARHIRQALATDGTVLLVEPIAGDGPRAQAGERRLDAVLRAAGFSRVRRATQTPFNLILEARP